MATQREIRKRIQSVTSTKKITKTMEMISTSKMKKMQDRLTKSRAFGKRLENILYTLKESGMADSHNLFNVKRVTPNCLILMITGNRGLCGGYNSNVIDNTLSFKEQLEVEEKKDVLVDVIGQKGINYLKFMNIPMRYSEANLEDKLTFDDAQGHGRRMIGLFESDKVDEIYISYTKAVSSATFKPAIYKLLPVSIEELEKETVKEEEIKSAYKAYKKYIFEPDPQKILSSLLPLYINMKLYLMLLESGYSEQNARRQAMKNATDAASEMVRDLTIKYNRARQAKITNEISEIVGGASALE